MLKFMPRLKPQLLPLLLLAAAIVAVTQAGHIPGAAETVEIVGGPAPAAAPVAPPAAVYPFALPAGYAPYGSSFSGHRVQHTLAYAAAPHATQAAIAAYNIAPLVEAKPPVVAAPLIAAPYAHYQIFQ